MHRGGEPSLTDSIGCPIVTQESQHSRTFHNVVTDDFYQKIEQNENINTVHVYMQDLQCIYTTMFWASAHSRVSAHVPHFKASM